MRDNSVERTQYVSIGLVQKRRENGPRGDRGGGRWGRTASTWGGGGRDRPSKKPTDPVKRNGERKWTPTATGDSHSPTSEVYASVKKRKVSKNQGFLSQSG